MSVKRGTIIYKWKETIIFNLKSFLESKEVPYHSRNRDKVKNGDLFIEGEPIISIKDFRLNINVLCEIDGNTYTEDDFYDVDNGQRVAMRFVVNDRNKIRGNTN